MGRHPNRQRQQHDKNSIDHTRKKRKRLDHKDRPSFAGPAHPKSHKVNPTKSRIRDLRRLLSKVDDMPADVRIAHERELSHLQRDLEIEEEEVRKDQQKKDMFACYQKYKMVRFFDKQKAERRLKKIKKEYETADTSDRERLSQEMHDATLALNYTIYYPLGKVYCSLYPSKKDKDGKKNIDQEESEPRTKANSEIWQQIEEAMAEGKEALERLRRQLPEKLKADVNEEPVDTIVPKGQRKKPVEDARMKDANGSDEEEDAENGLGFFET